MEMQFGLCLVGELQGVCVRVCVCFWWGLLHGPQQGPDRMKEKTYKTGLPKQKNPP